MATAINLLHRHGLIVNSDTYTRRLSEPVAKREIKNISANRSKVKISQLDLRVVQIARARADFNFKFARKQIFPLCSVPF